MDIVVLGAIAVHVDGREVPVGGPRQRRLLAALVRAEGRVVSTGQLVEAVWADEAVPPAAAERTLQSYVSRLRGSLGDGRVVGEAGGYRLQLGDVVVDATRFAALVADAACASPAAALPLLDTALALWRGPAYAEFAHEDWVRPVAAGLEELRLVALERRSQARLDLGQHAEVVADLEFLAREHPLRERFEAQLMLALHRSGRQGDALRSFQRHRTTLAEETGLNPSRELIDLERRIALDDPSLAFVAGGRVARGYVLADEIGSGSFGTVYRAVQPSVGREVAVKVVRPELADDPEYVRRFETEARLVARLEHPHAVPLYDFWREPGGAYLVFRYLRGGTASTRHTGQWPLTDVDRLATEIGSALAVAHAAGVTHRDVKPANVLFDEAGNAYLADFGIAVDRPEHLAVGALPSAGSPLYASPEQARDGVASAASDQYAFGVMLWELLAGRPPFDGADVSTLLRHKLAQPVPALRTVRPDIPAPVGDVLQRATAVHPLDRYPTMAMFLLAWADAIRRPEWATATADGTERAQAAGTQMATLARLGLGETNPYKGLRPFDEADAGTFFGREDDTDALARLVGEHPFTAVVGPSGSGKSSLVRAGVVPRLRAEGSLVVVMTPGADPAARMIEALREVTIGDGQPRTVADAVTAAVPADGQLVVVLDQFEELWTAGDADERVEVLAALTGSSSIKVVVTIRADFYDRPLADPVVGALVRDATFALAPLTPVELERAITAPATRIGVSLEPGLVADLVADVSAQPASLPLLQYALTELYDHRDGATMTLDAYEAMGRLAGAMTARAEAVCASAPEDDSRRLFTRLVNPGEGVEDTRRRTRMGELVAVPSSVIDAYGAARLLTFDVDPATREPTVEVAHEALLRYWPRLRAWLDDDRDGLRLRRHLSDAALAWDAAGRPAADLYRGARLESAAQWAQANRDALTPLEQRYLDEARRRHRRSRRLARAAVSSISVLLVVAVVAAAVAAVQGRRAEAQRDTARALRRDADTKRLVAESGRVQRSDLALSLLLAREANGRVDDALTRGALQSALVSNDPILGYLRATPTATYGAIAPGATAGQLYVSRADEGVIEVWDADARHRVRTIPVTESRAVETLAVSPSHRRAAAVLAGTDATLILDTASGSVVTTADVPRMRALGAAARPAFLDDDHVLSFRDAEVLLVDLRSGRVVTTYTAPTPIKSLTVQGTRVFLGFAKQGGGVGVGIVDATTWSPVAEIPVPLPGNIFWQVTPSVDGRTVAVSVPGSSQQQGVLLDLASGAQVGPFWPQQAVIPAALPDGGFLVGSSAGELHRRSATGEQLGSTVKLYNGTTPLDGIVVEGDRAYVAGPAGVAIVSVPLIDGAAGPSKLSRPLRGLTGFTVSATEGLAVAQRTTDGKVLVAHLDRDEDPIALEPSGARSTGGLPALLNVSPDGRLIASAGAAGVLSIFDTATLSLVQTIPYALDRPVDSSFTSSLGDAARRYAVVFWLSSTTAILGTLDSVVAIDLTTGQRRWEARGFRDEVDSLAVSSDGSLVLATDYYGTARLLRSDDGSEVGAPLGNGSMTDAERRTAPRVPVNYVAFVPGGHVALLDDWDSGTIRVVDVDSRTEVAPPMHIAAGTTLLRVSGDGELLAVGGTEGLVRLYDLATRAQIGDPFPSGTNLTSAIFAPDDRAFIERGNPPLVWDIDPASWREKACAVAGRNMTKAEWRQYMPPDEAYRPTCPALPVET